MIKTFTEHATDHALNITAGAMASVAGMDTLHHLPTPMENDYIKYAIGLLCSAITQIGIQWIKAKYQNRKKSKSEKPSE